MMTKCLPQTRDLVFAYVHKFSLLAVRRMCVHRVLAARAFVWRSVPYLWQGDKELRKRGEWTVLLPGPMG